MATAVADDVPGGQAPRWSCPSYACHPPDSEKRGDSKIAFAGRLKVKPGKHGKVEVHTPDVCIAIYEPLLVVLLGYVKQDEALGGNFQRTPPSKSRMPPQRPSGLPFYMKSRPSSARGLYVATGRFGPLKQAVTVNDTETSVAMATWKSSFFQHCDNLLHAAEVKRKLKSSQKFFEKVVGLQLEKHDWDVKCDIGPIHCAQVGEYSNLGVLVEEYRVWPLQMTIDRGVQRLWGSADDKMDIRLDADFPYGRQIAVEAEAHKQSEAKLPPWNDSVWDAAEEQCTTTIQQRQLSIEAQRIGSLGLFSQSQGERTEQTTASSNDDQTAHLAEVLTEASSDNSAEGAWCHKCAASAKSIKPCDVPKKPAKHRCKLLRQEKANILVETLETGKAKSSKIPLSRRRREAMEKPAVEASFRIIPHAVFASGWLEKENKQWREVVRGSLADSGSSSVETSPSPNKLATVIPL